MRKLDKHENYLELIPVRNPHIRTEHSDQKVILTVPNVGFFNKVAQICFQRPEESKIHLDPYASFVWEKIDGKRDIASIGDDLKEKYGKRAEPLYPRLIQFMDILKQNHYIGLTDKTGERIK